MNILFLGFNDALASIPIYVCTKLHIKPHIVTNNSSIDFETQSILDYRSCSLGNFPKLNNLKSYSLSEDILQSFMECESQALKMMDRFEEYEGLLLYENRLNLYHKQLRFWLSFIDTYEIDNVVFNTIPHVVHDYIVYEVCKYFNIKTHMFYRLPILPNLNTSIYYLHDFKQHLAVLPKIYRENFLDKSKTKLRDDFLGYLDLRNSEKRITFTGVQSKSRGILKFFSPKKILNYFNYLNIQIPEIIKRRLTVKEKMLKLASSQFLKKKNFKFKNYIDNRKKSIYVSLHFQPECSTSPMGGNYVHQDFMISLLQAAAPTDYNIYVKPHIREGIQSKLSRRIKLDKRTFILNPKLNANKLIQDSDVIATVTGTAGWEAFINKKNVLIFGDNFYKHAPGVYRIHSYEDLRKAFELIKSTMITEEDVIAFLKAIQEISFPGWVDNRYSLTSNISYDKNATSIGDKIIHELTLGSKN